jgi:hypothetical protein
VIAITAPRERAARLGCHIREEQIMTTRQNNTQSPGSTKAPDPPDAAAAANRPSIAELGDDQLDRVSGGQLPKLPEPPDPCIK